jgi:glycosyltransferase involved in cell wall biosynthesis
LAKKVLFLNKYGERNVPISHSIHSNLFFNFPKNKNLQICEENVDNLKNIDINNYDYTFLIHKFDVFDDKNFKFLQGKPLIVFPTQMVDDEKILKKTFNGTNISNIIVGLDYYQKFFNKILNIPLSKIKLINIPCEQYDNSKIYNKSERVILTPGLLRKEKNYISLLKAIINLKKKYRNLLYILSLKTHLQESPENNKELLDEIKKFIIENNMKSYVKLMLDSPYPYENYLNYTDIILLPKDNSENMYSGVLIDAIVAGKPIVTYEFKHAYHLCKKDAGIYLYNDKDEDLIIDDCSTILDNKDIKQILENQNKEMQNVFTNNKISQQYLNLLKRFK